MGRVRPVADGHHMPIPHSGGGDIEARGIATHVECRLSVHMTPRGYTYRWK